MEIATTQLDGLMRYMSNYYHFSDAHYDDEDLLQEMKLALWLKQPTDWIKSFLHNTVVDAVRKLRPWSRSPNQPTFCAWSEYADTRVHYPWEWVDQMIDWMRLPQRTQRVIALRLEGYTLREIGDRLGLTDSRVSQIISREVIPCAMQ